MDALIVTINGEAKNAQVSNGVPGIYVLGPNSINGKSHWLQELGSNAIWYKKGSGWRIGPQDNIGSILSFDDVATPQQVSTWYYYNGQEYVQSDDIMVESGLCIHHSIHKYTFNGI